MNDLTPLALKDAPALIESVFPAQKISVEAQRERKAGAGQTLTALGSYWKGRKPLILVRAITLGSLLPQTGSPETDLQIFESLMGFDDECLARRALEQNALKPADIALRIILENPWDYFAHDLDEGSSEYSRIEGTCFPADLQAERIRIRWRRDLKKEDRLEVYRKVIEALDTYEEKSALCKRPEEVDEEWLYGWVWPSICQNYSVHGISAKSHNDLIEQLGLLRYGRRPRVGDTFCGGGSIPFEAARLGCDVYASDLNPIACMLSWGALNIIGASEARRSALEERQKAIFNNIDEYINELGVEHNSEGHRAKAYLYCQEVRCPETGWSIPVAPNWIISKTRRTIAKLSPDHERQRFNIDVISDASRDEMSEAKVGTAVSGSLTYELDGRTYRTPLRTIRGDYRNSEGKTENKLRKWGMSDFAPRADDIFQERLYCVYWMHRDTLDDWRPSTFFSAVEAEDLERERRVNEIVSQNFTQWQEQGLVPDMPIEPGEETTRLVRERGWTHWHHLFNSRNLLYLAKYKEASLDDPVAFLYLAELLNYSSRLCAIKPGGAGSRSEEIWIGGVFANQALNTFLDFGTRSFWFLPKKFPKKSFSISDTSEVVECQPAERLHSNCDLFITDPPYADAVNYHEITEFFIAWLRKNPPKPFDKWVWDSRRALAIKGSGDDFRRGMVDAYRAMAEHMPDNGMQCVMFTHQDTGVWSDMVGIFWAAGLQVVAAWYIATETTSELKKGGYVQGTVILMLRKRQAGERSGFKQRILPAVRTEVERQIEGMMHLNEEVKDRLGEPVFNDSDLQMAGYAAALKVLTAYTHIGGEDVTSFALRPRQRGEETVVDEIVQQAAEAANSLLVPEGLEAETWSRLTGIQRFYFRMMDMETTGARKLDNYQNFAKAFRVADYGKVMGSMAANGAQLKHVPEFESRDLTDSTEIGPTWLGRLIIGLQQLLAETEPQVVVSQIQEDLPDFLEVRPVLIDMLSFIERKAPEQQVRDAAEILGGRLKNLRAFSQ